MADDLITGDRGDGPGGGLDEMCDRIVTRHHAYLHKALPVIGAELARLTDAESAPMRSLADTQAAFAGLALQLEGHLAKEENGLFPALEAMARADREGGHSPALPLPTVLYPIRMMETEHARIMSAMDRLREVTNGFVAAEDASDDWRRCLSECARLDEDLRAHLQAENEILFPRALELERRLL